MRVVGLIPPRRLSVSLLVVALALVASAGDAAASGNLVTNGTFDNDITGWVLDTGSILNTLSFAPNEDADGNPASGAAELRIGEGPFPSGQSYVETAVQCIPVVAGESYLALAEVRIPTANQHPDTEANLSLFWYAGSDCSGIHISSTSAGWVGVSNEWQLLSKGDTAPLTAQAVNFRLEVDGQDPVGPTQSYAYFDNAVLVLSLIGDADCNKVVNAIDASLILQHTAGLVGSLRCQDNADVNSDGNVDSLDAVLVLQYVAGLIPSLPPP